MDILTKSYATLEELTNLHIELSERIDFNKDDRRRAIWYLQGCSISTTRTVLTMYKEGYAVAMSHEWRFINEVRELVQLFDIMQDNDRRINAWYKGHVINWKNGEHPTEPFMEILGDEHFLKTEKARKDLINQLSKFAHPTTIVRYNVHRTHDGELFDYEWSTIKEFEELKIIVRAALMCSIHCFLLPLRTINLDQSTRDKLTKLYNEAEATI